MTKIGTTSLDVFPLCLGGNVFGWTADERQPFAVLGAYAAAVSMKLPPSVAKAYSTSNDWLSFVVQTNTLPPRQSGKTSRDVVPTFVMSPPFAWPEASTVPRQPRQVEKRRPRSR